MAPHCAPGTRLRPAHLISATLVGVLTLVVACGPSRADPPVAISYDATPRPIPSETVRPTFTRIRSARVSTAARTATSRPRNTPPPALATIVDTENPPADNVQPSVDQDPAATPSDPAADGAATPSADVASEPPGPDDAAPTSLPTAVGSVDANPGPNVDNEPGPSPTALAGLLSPTPIPRVDLPTPVPQATATRARTATRTPTPSSYPGQVSADVGLFVTSRTSGTEYYYARDDIGWHRIHTENQVWFMSAADLLRAFPNRAFHAPTPTRTPTRAP